MLDKITENIYRLVVKFPFGMKEVNSYLIKGDNGYTVIDTGSYSKESIAIWEQVLASGIVIEKVVLTHTHTHPDHIGLARWFQELVSVPVYISNLGYEEIKRVQKQLKEESRLNTLIIQHGGPEIPEIFASNESSAYDFTPDGLFKNHQHIHLGNDVYETIWTPGHSSDHFCFYNKQQKVMVIGDYVLANISPIIGISGEEEENPLKEYFASLELIKTYPVDLALPGHGDLIANLQSRADEIISSHNSAMKK